jgi:hypothetical protein
VLALVLRPLVIDDLVATGTFTLDTGSPGRIALDVRLADFEPGRRDRLESGDCRPDDKDFRGKNRACGCHEHREVFS